MLSHNPSDNEPAAADTAIPAPGPVAGADPMQAFQDQVLQDMLASPEFQTYDGFDTSSPLFSDTASPLFDVDTFLTSPGDTPYDDFATSPAEDSPFSDFLTTPIMSLAGDDADMLTGPVIDDGGYSGELFGGLSDYPYEVPAAPKLPSTEQLYTISPGTPALDSIDPSSTVFPAKAKPSSAVHRAEAPKSGSNSKRRVTATGTRKNLKPESLIPLEAPTQKRNYVTPSATSRKAVPAVFAQKKRQHSVAFAGDDDEAELGVLSPTASEAETIEYKRRQNTLAARKSRKRKLEHQQMLEDEIVVLKADLDKWKTRAILGQDLLRANGVPTQPFED